MKKVNYKEKGITLIALVITIIILLILAGITLNTALGKNGLFQKAKMAGEKYKESERDENEKLGDVSNEIDKILNGEGEISGTPITEITLWPESVDLYMYPKSIEPEPSSTELVAEIIPEEATNQDLNWKIDNSEIADIEKIENAYEEYGVQSAINVIGKKAGKTTITASAQDGSGKSVKCPVRVWSELATVAEEGLVFEENTTVTDEYGNAVVIPAGFKVVKDEEDDDIKYGYSGDSTNPTVQDGIVIEDVMGEEGNQFVWVPIGKIKNKDSGTTDMKLIRCLVEGGECTERIETEERKLTCTNCGATYVEETKEEHEKSNLQNAIAKDIEQFVLSANTNHGYYIARYEAKKESNEKAVSKKEGEKFHIKQPEASELAKKMYDGENYTSDLVNSYAWDTKKVFIENYCNEKYPGASSYCNICEIGSYVGNNDFEWSTESIPNNGNFCFIARDYYHFEDVKMWDIDDRYVDGTDYDSYASCTFRAILYFL